MMKFEEAYSKAKESVTHVLEGLVMEGTSITDNSDFVDLGLDSLDKVEVAMELENALDVDILDTDLMAMTTVSDIVEYLAQELVRK